ncbi:MAG: winged helix-turn-helix domain-containing protein [Thermoplasmatota archaeon]
MPKVTLNKEAFKALASETRLDIIKTLDGKQMNLTELSTNTKLNKATLHEHLKKLIDTGLVKKKQRPGHKWVYYKLSWKGESLLHPENTKIVVLFTTSFVALFAAITQIFLWAKGTILSTADYNQLGTMDATDIIQGNKSTLPPLPNGTSFPENGKILLEEGRENVTMIYQDPLFLYIAIICFTCFAVILSIAIYKLWQNKTIKL